MPGQSTPSTPKQRQLDKALHIDQILRLLSTRPKGLTCAEIARAVGLKPGDGLALFQRRGYPPFLLGQG